MAYQFQLLPHNPSSYNQPIPINRRWSRNKTLVKYSITLVIFLIILASSIAIMVVKKQPTASSSMPATTFVTHNIPITSTTVTKTTTIRETRTSFFGPNDTLTTLTPGDESNRITCPLPLIPTYNSHKTVVAGNGSRGSTDYELNQPIAIALDSEHNLYVLDAGNIRVVKYSSNSNKGQVILGHGVNRYPRTNNLKGLAIDKNDLLYTYQEDTQRNGQIVSWPSSLKNGTELMKTIGRLSGFAVDQELNIYTVTGINLWIWLPPRYKDSVTKRVFGQQNINGMIPTGTSSIYVDFSSNLFAIDILNYRIQKTEKDDDYSETILRTKPTPLAIVGDCHGHLYTIDSQSSLIIYDSTGKIISAMRNTIDSPYDPEFWQHTYAGQKTEDYIPDYFAALALDSKKGDLYVIMYGYDKVVKFTLI